MLKYLVALSFYFMLSKSFLEYGEFDLKISNFESYKGPKRKNCVEIETTIVNDVALDMDYRVIENMKTIKAKIIGSVDNKELVRLEVKNLCEHIFFKPLIQGLFNYSDHCGMEKGRYRLYADIQKISRNFYGGKFIYGNWKFKWNFYNDYCNLQHASIFFSMTPKVYAVGGKQ